MKKNCVEPNRKYTSILNAYEYATFSLFFSFPDPPFFTSSAASSGETNRTDYTHFCRR